MPIATPGSWIAHGRGDVLATLNRAIPVLPWVARATRLRLTTSRPAAHCGTDDVGETLVLAAGR
jgi:hypothetical protein